jgi:hypothetical protein
MSKDYVRLKLLMDMQMKPETDAGEVSSYVQESSMHDVARGVGGGRKIGGVGRACTPLVS